MFLPVSLQDKAQPETQARSFGNVAFDALLAVDDSGALALVRQPASDGFRIDSSALFQVSVKKHMQPMSTFSYITNLGCAIEVIFGAVVYIFVRATYFSVGYNSGVNLWRPAETKWAN